MLHPTIEELTKGQYNRYELALATAKCARLITDEYVRQHDAAEKSQTGNKETDRPINTMIDRELRDEKAVHVAVNRINAGEYEIDVHAGEREEEEAAEASDEE
ncbi:MAG: DNA-directed RNA polymerase subunit omega [Clostridia bacterium]|nr:DNA-directed RNA polymerase subunit omega [Clostridia bacterium]